jgi:hypothetical protein
MDRWIDMQGVGRKTTDEEPNIRLHKIPRGDTEEKPEGKKSSSEALSKVFRRFGSTRPVPEKQQMDCFSLWGANGSIPILP